MKKLIAVLLVLVCALSLFSCKRGADQAPMGEITETSNADTPCWNYVDDAVLNELNAGSRTVCFYADTTLCSVNAFSNQLYREVGVGQTVYEAVHLMYETLAEALPVLAPFAPAQEGGNVQ